MNTSARPDGARTAAPRRGAAAVVLRGVERPEYRGDSAQSRRVMAAAVLAVHLLFGWTLLQLQSVRHVVQAVAPLVVRLLPLSPPPTPPVNSAPVKAPDLPQRTVPLVPPPLFEVTPVPTTTTITVAVVAPVVVHEAVVTAPRASSAPAVAQPAPVVPSLKRVAPGAVRYRVEPRLTMPLLSKRLHESGIVYLLLTVDARGLLASATVQKSSGFARLDAQALQDIRTARFVPQTENGQPIEWETVAPMSYELN